MGGFETATISRRTEWAPGLITVTLDVTPPSFIAGQFFNLALPSITSTPPGVEPKRDLIRRSYSASSGPGEALEFFISEVPEGALTPRMLQLHEGDEILWDPKGLGYFTLDHVPNAKTLWLIATGTGLAPFVSMLRSGAGLQDYEQVILVQGVRKQAQLAYAEELRAAAASSAGKLRYLPATSRDAAAREGLSGRITENFESGDLEAAAHASIDKDSQVLLCGNPAMIKEMVELMKARGLTKHRKRTPGQFHFESYW